MTTIRLSVADVLALAEHFTPNRVVPSAQIYEKYVDLERAAGREPASSLALARALTRSGWEQRRIRKARGRRGQQRFTETHCRVIPGGSGPPVTEQDEQMGAVILRLLDGREDAFVPKDSVWTTYQALVREHGWRDPDNLLSVTSWLKDRGVVLMTYGGQRGKNGWAGVKSYYLHTGFVPEHMR